MNREIAMMIIAQQLLGSYEVQIRYDRNEEDVIFEINVKGTPEEVLKTMDLITNIQVRLGAKICISPTFKD
jgi:hypothetical protein